MSDGSSARTLDSVNSSWSACFQNGQGQEPQNWSDVGWRADIRTNSSYVNTGGSALSYHDPSRDARLWTQPRYDQSQHQIFDSPQHILPFRPLAPSHVQYPLSTLRDTQTGVHEPSPPTRYDQVYTDGAQNVRPALHSPTSSVSSRDFVIESPRRFSTESHAGQWNYGASVARMCQNGEGNNFVQTYHTRQAILSSRREAYASDKTLYESFKRKDKPRKFFVVGKVFLTWWAEPASDAADDAGTVITGGSFTMGTFGQRVFSKIRRFIVVREAEQSCACLPIVTYGGQGVGKRGTKKYEHAIIYTGKVEPSALPNERPARGEMGLLPSIRVDPDTPEQKLDPVSRVDFAKVYTIEHFARVQSVGKINRQSMTALLNQFQFVWSKDFDGPGRQMSTGLVQHRSKMPESTPASHLERIAAYHALRASGWAKERACSVLFTDFGLPIPILVQECEHSADRDGQAQGESHDSAVSVGS